MSRKKQPKLTMPFGKFKRKTIAEILAIEPSYLAWFVHTVERYETIKEAITSLPEWEAILAKWNSRKPRTKPEPKPQPDYRVKYDPNPPAEKETIEDKVKAILGSSAEPVITPDALDQLCDQLFNG